MIVKIDVIKESLEYLIKVHKRINKKLNQTGKTDLMQLIKVIFQNELSAGFECVVEELIPILIIFKKIGYTQIKIIGIIEGVLNGKKNERKYETDY